MTSTSTGPQPGTPRTRRTRTRSTRKETPVNLTDAAPAITDTTAAYPVLTGEIRPPANVSECTAAAAAILESAQAAGLPAPSSITVYGWAPEINIMISGHTPADTWANLETWAARHGSPDISVTPSTGGADRAYASTEFTATGVRVCLCAIITGNPGTATGTAPGTENAPTLFDLTDDTSL